MEAEGEGDDKNQKDDEELGEGEEDVVEDDDVDPDDGKLLHVHEQVDPGQGDGGGRQLPKRALLLQN